MKPEPELFALKLRAVDAWLNGFTTHCNAQKKLNKQLKQIEVQPKTARRPLVRNTNFPHDKLLFITFSRHELIFLL